MNNTEANEKSASDRPKLAASELNPGVVAATPAETRASSDLMFALLHAAEGLQSRMEQAFEEIGLSSAKYFVLAKLAEEGCSLPLSELAARLSCVRSNMTQLIDRLEKDGLVRRVRDPKDRRVIRAELTETGAELAGLGAIKLADVERSFASTLAGIDKNALGNALSALL
jgi:DNA-binding MarR family transcriptional regulator